MSIRMPIMLTDEQGEAVEAVQDWFKARDPDVQVFLLDGAAGTGKSTVAGVASQRLGIPQEKIVFGAYTAKAARVMEEKGMTGATTLHRMLYYKDHKDNEWKEVYPNGPCAHAELIVVDEVSMVNDNMVEDILKYGKPVLVLGDIEGQLPPIEGAGAFVKRRPSFRLHEIHRTVLESPINRLAWAVRHGYNPRPGDSVASDPDALVERFLAPSWDKVTNRDWQVICGKHRTRMAVTRRCRADFGYAGPTPEPGEPIICCRNDYNRGFLNGDIAVIWRIVKDNPALDHFIADLLVDSQTVEDVPIFRHMFEQHFVVDQQNVPYPKQSWKATLFDWAYGITVHKAQGSEWANVIFIDDQFAKWDKDLRRRLMYTAITRAREKLLFLTVGDGK